MKLIELRTGKISEVQYYYGLGRERNIFIILTSTVGDKNDS